MYKRKWVEKKKKVLALQDFPRVFFSLATWRRTAQTSLLRNVLATYCNEGYNYNQHLCSASRIN